VLKALIVLRRHAVAFTALFLLVGGVAYASVGPAGTSAVSKKLYACVAGDHRTLNLTTSGQACPNGQSKVSWDAGSARGARGPAGKAGARGATGAAGAAGTAGATGAVGPAGAAGAKGADGAPGPQGAPGAKGDDGAAGADGDDGDDGADGAQGPIGPVGPTGPAGPAEFAEFFALMPPDNAATIAPGTDVSFPQDGPASGNITRTSADEFNLAEAGIYRVAFNVSISEAGQLILTLNGVDLAYTVTGRATGTSQITGEAFVETSSSNAILTVRNPASNSTALTVTPLAGGANPVSATLTIEQLQGAI
jgi:hypothetical protein